MFRIINPTPHHTSHTGNPFSYSHHHQHLNPYDDLLQDSNPYYISFQTPTSPITSTPIRQPLSTDAYTAALEQELLRHHSRQRALEAERIRERQRVAALEQELARRRQAQTLAVYEAQKRRLQAAYEAEMQQRMRQAAYEAQIKTEMERREVERRRRAAQEEMGRRVQVAEVLRRLLGEREEKSDEEGGKEKAEDAASRKSPSPSLSPKFNSPKTENAQLKQQQQQAEQKQEQPKFNIRVIPIFDTSRISSPVNAVNDTVNAKEPIQPSLSSTHTAAGQKILTFLRKHRPHLHSLHLLRNLRSQFTALSTSPETLSTLSIAPSALAVDDTTKSFAVGNKKNAKVLELEEKLTRLVVEADRILSEGCEEVRRARREFVKEVLEWVGKIEDLKRRAVEEVLGAENTEAKTDEEVLGDEKTETKTDEEVFGVEKTETKTAEEASDAEKTETTTDRENTGAVASPEGVESASSLAPALDTPANAEVGPSEDSASTTPFAPPQDCDAPAKTHLGPSEDAASTTPSNPAQDLVADTKVASATPSLPTHDSDTPIANAGVTLSDGAQDPTVAGSTTAADEDTPPLTDAIVTAVLEVKQHFQVEAESELSPNVFNEPIQVADVAPHLDAKDTQHCNSTSQDTPLDDSDATQPIDSTSPETQEAVSPTTTSNDTRTAEEVSSITDNDIATTPAIQDTLAVLEVEGEGIVGDSDSVNTGGDSVDAGWEVM